MITLSLDPHPGSQTLVALDPNGASWAHITVPNTPEGLSQWHQFAIPFATRRWAIEGAGNHLITTFVSQLVGQGETVYSIPPSLTSQYRSRRGGKKNDVVDAENVGRALLANPQPAALHSSDQQKRTRAQRRLSEQLKGNRGALKELTTVSPVREILQQASYRHSCNPQLNRCGYHQRSKGFKMHRPGTLTNAEIVMGVRFTRISQ